ncbi:MAG: hypothetical protein DMF56_11485 [Acidobacteria bacterium]|nr:MAG: hypothetical protein DMF56_11485 [Acidobacteriota bacterium]
MSLFVAAAAADAMTPVQWNGFALLRPQTPARVPLDGDELSAQFQLGLDWRPFAGFGTHVHLLARNQGDESRRGRAGIVEAYAEKNLNVREDRVRILAGAFFLPTSRENVDSLWETPYTLTPSALNSWLGEELRPIGVDVSYRHRTAKAGTFSGGATLFGGNDTFGELLIGRGWALQDRWALLGEHVRARPNAYTSVSAENDDRPGWSARAKWNNDHGTIQLTRIDNRSDALRHGELIGWATRFNIVGADYTWRDWTVAGESGWGTTAIVTARGRFSSDIAAGYLLVSRRLKTFRVSVRADEYKVRDVRENAVTAALLWEAHPRLRAGIEGIAAAGQKRMAVELRFHF